MSYESALHAAWDTPHCDDCPYPDSTQCGITARRYGGGCRRADAYDAALRSPHAHEASLYPERFIRENGHLRRID